MKKVVCLIITFVLMFVLFGCSESEGLESGFEAFGNESIDFCCGYKTSKTIFNKSDVKLNFYFGFGRSKEDEELKITEDVESVTIRLLLSGKDNKGTTHKKLIKEIDAKAFFAQKYKCTLTAYEHKYPSGLTTIALKIEYNHSEKIKIPEEFFSGSYGLVIFEIYPYYTYYDKEPSYGTGDLVNICYEVDDKKVTLSHELAGEM